jgi:hypothetical protein
MISRRKFLYGIFGAAAAGATTCPYTLGKTSYGIRLEPAFALAQGNGGGGQGKGKGGHGQGDGKGKGGENGNGQDGASAASSKGVSMSNPNGGVVHRNGMRETILNGRYEMHDAQGRRIISREATLADYLRMRLSR